MASTGKEFSSVSPRDAAIAMRSWPRRYGALLRPIDDESNEEKVAQIGKDGVSALEVATDTARTWALIEKAMNDIRLHDDVIVHPAIVDHTQRQWASEIVEPLSSVLAQLNDNANALADFIDVVGFHDWNRVGKLVGGQEISLLELAQIAVATGAGNLRRIETILSEL